MLARGSHNMILFNSFNKFNIKLHSFNILYFFCCWWLLFCVCFFLQFIIFIFRSCSVNNQTLSRKQRKGYSNFRLEVFYSFTFFTKIPFTTRVIYTVYMFIFVFNLFFFFNLTYNISLFLLKYFHEDALCNDFNI
jgi:hypothetical protein